MAIKKVIDPTTGEEIFSFHCNNLITYYRCSTFFTKEPETLNWIDSFEKESCLWDIGANIGLYSIYAAKQKRCTVYAFEPSIFNIELLGKNIFLNKVQDRVCIIPIALTDADGINTFVMGSIEHGGAHSSFGTDFGYDGKKINEKFSYNILGMTGDSFSGIFGVRLPDYIKIDVDGIEHYILNGMKDLLRNVKVKSVIVEGNDNFQDQVMSIDRTMKACGFYLQSKQHATVFDNGDKFSKTYNQIWVRFQ